MTSVTRAALAVILFCAAAIAAPNRRAAPSSTPPVLETTCAGKTYAYDELAGYGYLAGDARDKFGDTIAGIGSSMAIDKSSWKKKGNTWTGLLYALPDRGWNTQGSINYTPRVHKLVIKFTPNEAATVSSPGKPNIQFEYFDTILLTAPDGSPCTGLDADAKGGLSYPGFPLLPAATFSGNGFGNAGPGGKRVSIDSEGIVLAKDGGFWISDEYGPYVYQFDRNGRMLSAIAPPNAILPVRNATVSFSSNSPPAFNPNITVKWYVWIVHTVHSIESRDWPGDTWLKLRPLHHGPDRTHASPGDPSHGRQNNQGFEGLTVSPDGDSLYVLLQSAAIQEGGNSSSTRRYTRFLKYDISGCSSHRPSAPKYASEWVVPLPIFLNVENKTAIAAQSEVHYLSDTQFLVIARDSGAGHGQSRSASLYRHVDIFDISKATNVKGDAHDAFNGSIASTAGTLNSDITPATYCSFIDVNLNSQLNRFGVHNGGAQDATLLNEKWESLALLPADHTGEYYLFAMSDDDFITQNGYIKNGTIKYADKSGFNLDNQALVFKITLPQSQPLVG